MPENEDLWTDEQRFQQWLEDTAVMFEVAARRTRNAAARRVWLEDAAFYRARLAERQQRP